MNICQGRQILNKAKLSREKKTVEIMIRIYCQNKHHTEENLCAECAALLLYARQHLDDCPLGSERKTCARCEVHCYKPEQRKKIRAVMKYSGPRLILHHPMLLLRHFFDSIF